MRIVLYSYLFVAFGGAIGAMARLGLNVLCNGTWNFHGVR